VEDKRRIRNGGRDHKRRSQVEDSKRGYVDNIKMNIKKIGCGISD
jgi:hypothetical protein